MSVFTVVDQNTINTSPITVTDSFMPSTAQITVDPNSIAIVNGPTSISFYDGSLAALGIGSGLLITSGTVPGLTNTVPYFGIDNAMPGDPDLDAVVNTVFATTSYDATSISLNFDVTDPAVTGVSFKIVFGTDEYPEWVDQFVDIAIVEVNGVNVAHFGNDPNAVLSVVTSNLAAGYFIDNANSVLPIEYDGVSNVLSVFAPVHAGTNTLKIAIADTGDHIYDSGLFISSMTATNVPVGGINLDVPCTIGDDVKVGTDASESFNALAGNDSIDGGGGDDVIQGGDGQDDLQGGSGKDFLDGGVGPDNVNGGADDDTIQFSGDDQIDGGTGNDTLLIDASTLGAPVTLDISTPSQVLPDGSTITGIEILNFTGGAEVDAVTGSAFGDIINTGAGDDVVKGGAGDDQINGGDGTDTAVFDGTSANYLVTALQGGGFQVQDLTGPEGTDTLQNIELLQFSDGTFAAAGLIVSGAEIHGTPNDDVISDVQSPAGQPFATALGDTVFADAGDDNISTGAGNDTIYTGADNDKVDAGSGDDVIYGEGGDDEINGGDGEDSAVFSGAYADYTVVPGGDGWLVTDNRLNSPEGSDQYTSVEHLVFTDTTLTVGIGAPPSVTGGDTGGDFVEPVTPNGTQSLTGSLSFTDPDDADTHTVEVAGSTGNTAGVVFTPNLTVPATDGQVGNIDWSFDIDTSVIDSLADGQVRTLTYTLRINDSGGNHTDEILTFHLTGTNDAPVISGDVNAPVNEDDPVVSADALANASDVDAGAKLFVVNVPSLPPGVSYDVQTHTFTLDPTDSSFQPLKAGQQTQVDIAYGVSDGIATTAAHVVFTVTGVNDGPATSAVTLAAIAEDSGAHLITQSDLLAHATDIDGPTLTATNLAIDTGGGLLVDNNDGTWSYTPALNDNSAVSFTYTVTDGDLTAAGSANLDITPVNDAPTVATPLGDTSVEVDNAFLYQVAPGTFTDVDGDTLTLSAALSDGSALPGWLSFDPTTGGFSGTPTATGSLDIRVTATDPSLASGSDVFTLTIDPHPTSVITGTSGADVLNGTAVHNEIYGLAGNDRLSGLDGDDLLDGGAGNDVIDGGAGNDTASFASAAGGVHVNLSKTKGQQTGEGRDTLINIENLDGSGFADQLTGNSGNNVLSGNNGADVLIGGAGADDLWGGAGADRFDFNALAESTLAARDTIHDFSHIEGDLIDLSGIDAIGRGKDNAFSLVNAFTHVAGQLTSTFDSDHYVVQGDVNGDGAADFAINVFSSAALVAGDFLL